MQPLANDDPAEIGGYRLRARLGSGGMGRVYLAATSAGRLVALKVVRPELGDDPEFRARFRQEIEAARRVHGLYTAQLLDAGPAATPPWLVTAYVPGPSLQQAVARHGPMPGAMVFRLIAGVAEALQAIHVAGVVHRDLKPSNVLLAPDGPRVIDFGIARALESASLTRTGIMMGSPLFVAPEQILDQPVTPAIDVFGLGALAVYAALGRPPFGEGHNAAVSHRVLHEQPDLDGCPAPLRTLIGSCLAKDPAARPALGQILEFCATWAAGMADSSPSWDVWGLADDLPGTGPARTAAASTLRPAFPEQARTGRPGKRRIRRAAALAAAALAAGAIVIAVTMHLAFPGKAALGTTAARSVAVTHHPATSAARTTPSGVPAAPARTRPARRRVVPPAPRSAAVRPAVLLSQGRYATASSLEGYPWAAANAVDGNTTTRWSSAWSDPQWLEVDLGARHALRKVVLDWENAYATAFQIQISASGRAWQTVYSTTTGRGGLETIPVRGTARYVRMYGTHRATGYGYSLWEFQVFGR
jgi:eukaryotic-like serine/threonine-protein kinase